MANHALPLRITPARRRALKRLAASGTASAATRRRARAVVMMADGNPGVEVARRCGYTTVQVSRIRRRFAEEGPDGLRERRRPGRPPHVAARVAPRVIALALHSAGSRPRSLSAREVARRCGVSHGTVLRIWKDHGIAASRRRTSRISILHSDPRGDRTCLEVVGLRVTPGGSALVLHLTLKEARRGSVRRGRGAGTPMERGFPSLVSALRRARSGGGIAEVTEPSEDLPRWLKRLRARHRRGEIHAVVESLKPVTRRALRRWLTWRRMVHLHLVPEACSWRAIARAWLSALARREPAHREAVARALELVDRHLGSVRGGGPPFQWPPTLRARKSGPRG